MQQESTIQISALEHYAYCPRQCGLIHIDGIWADNEHTISGTRAHRRVDTAPSRRERGQRVLRAIQIYSETYRLTGVADVIELHDDGSLIPVEYKAGVRHGNAADIQVCAQGLCLEEMTGNQIGHGYVWYAKPRRRERVNLTNHLRETTVATVTSVRDMIASGKLPEPAADSRCDQCQFQSICLPSVSDRTQFIASYMTNEVFSCGSPKPCM